MDGVTAMWCPLIVRFMRGVSTRQRDFLMLTEGICSDSRYLAMVRRATTMPCWLRISEILLSERGFRASSAATSCLTNARMAVADQAPPVSLATCLPHTYL